MPPSTPAPARPGWTYRALTSPWKESSDLHSPRPRTPLRLQAFRLCRGQPEYISGRSACNLRHALDVLKSRFRSASSVGKLNELHAHVMAEPAPRLLLGGERPPAH